MAEFSPSADRLATVFGGSGFVGRHIVRALARDGWRIRVAVRRPDLAGFLRPLGVVGQIELVQANLRYPEFDRRGGRGRRRRRQRRRDPAPERPPDLRSGARGRRRRDRARRQPRRGSTNSSTSRASAPTRVRPTPISPARGAARAPCARPRPPQSSCARRSSSVRRTISSSPASRLTAAGAERTWQPDARFASGRRPVCAARQTSNRKDRPMRLFAIDKDETITAFPAAEQVPEGQEQFASEKELAKLAANWPADRLTAIWNSFAGVAGFGADLKPVKKFTNRKTAVARIWKAIQALDAPAAAEATATTRKRPPPRQRAPRARRRRPRRPRPPRPRQARPYRASSARRPSCWRCCAARRRNDGRDRQSDRLAEPLCRRSDYADLCWQPGLWGGNRCDGVGIIRDV